jgi:sensor histidine kinase regulating citrate/malate metabolism
MDRESRRVSLKWKISGSFTGILIILSLVATVALYQLTRNTLRDQFEQRVLAIGTNLSDAAAGHIAAKTC